MRAAAVTWFPVFPFPAEKGNKNRNMIVLKSIYVRRTNQIQQQQQQQQQTTNKQTKKGLILTTSGQGRLDELVL